MAVGEADAEGEEEADADGEGSSDGDAEGDAPGVAAGAETEGLAGAVWEAEPDGPPQPARSAIAAADMATARSD